MTDTQTVAVLDVRDTFGRPRTLTVRYSDDSLTLVPPPGAGFTIPLRDVELLRQALADGRAAALRTGWTPR